MSLLAKLGIGYARRHPWHSILTIVGISLGIAVVLAVDVANESSRLAFQLTNKAISSGATHHIYAGPQGIDESHYLDLRVGKSLRNISPVVSGHLEIDGNRFLLLGIDPFASHDLVAARTTGSWDPAQLLRSGNPAIILDTTAERLGINVPGQLIAKISGQEHTFALISSIKAGNEIQATGLRNVLITDVATAQSTLGMVGKLTRIDVFTDDAATLQKQLSDPLRLVPGESRSHAMEQMTRAFHLNLSALSLLALVIGAFLIYNTMTLSVLHRREQFSVLRTLGMTPMHIFSGIILEALMLAAIGLVIGTLFGAWLGRLMVELVSTTINDLYFALDVQTTTLPLSSILKGAALAVTATLLSAGLPAWEAMRVNPVINATRSAAETIAQRQGYYLMLGGIGLWSLSIIILWSSNRSVLAGFASLFLIIMGFALVTPRVLSFSLRVAGTIPVRYIGTLGMLANRGVQSSQSRTQVAVAALSIAVSAVIGVSVMISSFRSSVDHWLINFLRADVYVAQQPTHRASGIDHSLIASVASRPEVRSVSTGRWTEIVTRDGNTRLFAVNLDRDGMRNFQLIKGNTDDIWPRFKNEDTVIISEAYAYRHQLHLGDSLVLPTDDRDVTFRIAAIFFDYGSDQGVVTMHRDVYNRHWDDPVVSSFAIFLRDESDAELFVDYLNQNQLIAQALRVRSNKTIRQKSLQIFDRTFIITDVLRLLAICISVIGILSALLAIQMERIREFSVLRVLGLTPRQLWGLITVESGLMGLIAGLIACPLGVTMAWVLIHVINRRSFGWSLEFLFDPMPLVMALLLSVGAALVAGLFPAYRMARSKPGSTIRYE